MVSYLRVVLWVRKIVEKVPVSWFWKSINAVKFLPRWWSEDRHGLDMIAT